MSATREVKGRQKKKPDAKKAASGPAKGGQASKYGKGAPKGGGGGGGGARTGARR